MASHGIVKVVGCLLNRGVGNTADTLAFENRSHDELVDVLVDYLNRHRHFLGYCHIESTQALNDRGVDVLLESGDCKIGFQIKSHFDVTQADFAANVKRQFAEALSHDLNHYFILICSAVKKETKNVKKKGGTKTVTNDYGQRVIHLLNCFGSARR